MSTITHFLNGNGGTILSSDVFVLLILFVIFLTYGFYFGKGSIISLILAFYPAQLFYDHFPFMSSVLVLKGDSLLILNKVLIFLVFLALFTILMSRYVFQDSGFGSMHYARIIGYAVAMVILTLIFTYSVVNLDLVHNFSPSIDVLFTGLDRIFFWSLAPLAILFVL